MSEVPVKLVTLVFCAGFGAMLGGACSSPNTDDLFGSGGAGGAHASTSAQGTSATNGPSTTSTSGTSSKSASSTAGPGPSASVGTGPSTSVGPTSTSTTGGPLTSVFCNGGPCTPGDVCCFNPTGPGDHCGQSGQCDPGFVELSCNGPEDCPGQVCCATVEANQTIHSIACQSSCSAQNEIVVCSQMQQNVCQGNTQCQTTNALGNGYRLCLPG